MFSRFVSFPNPRIRPDLAGTSNNDERVFSGNCGELLTEGLMPELFQANTRYPPQGTTNIPATRTSVKKKKKKFDGRIFDR
jgi:hypothetical protein